ncbi:MAG: TrmH family RNA methyltransferase [Candidatus Micrarchaeia archaeon]
MMRVVLVEPIYDINVGMVCRAMANFGLSDLWIVRPIAPLGLEAEKYARHAKNILKRAKIVDSIEVAVKGRYPVIATTASLDKGKGGLSRPIPLSELSRKKINLSKAALLLGREDFGLPRELVIKSDIVAFIETDNRYPSMNISNAASILFYALRGSIGRTIERNPADKMMVRRAAQYFAEITDAVRTHLRNPAKSKKAFSNLLSSGNVEQKEMRAMMCVLKEAARRLKEGSVPAPDKPKSSNTEESSNANTRPRKELS